MAEKKIIIEIKQIPLIEKSKTFSEGQIKDKPLIDKTSIAPPPPSKPKK